MGKGSSVLSPLPTPPGMHDCSHCGGELCLSARTLLQAEQLQELSDPLPRLHRRAILIATHSLKSSLSSPWALPPPLRSAACRPDRRSSEEHLQFKRDAYVTAVSRLKVNRLLRHPGPSLPCRVSGVLCSKLYASCQAFCPLAQPEDRKSVV